MAADGTLRAHPEAMRGFTEAVCASAEDLRNQLAALDDQVGQLLGGWRGASGNAYGAAWELWHRGAGEVEMGLSMLARLVAEAGAMYSANEAVSAQELREVDRG
jgi:WXG100 family type VII secretion target